MENSAKSVVPLNQAAELAVDRVGRKAWMLAQLLVAGLPVPDGFVVTDRAWLQPADQLATQVRQAVAQFPDRTRFAIRSSAAQEDLGGTSYAGQYDTFLDIPGGQVAATVMRFQDAAVAARVQAYRSHLVDSGGSAPPVDDNVTGSVTAAVPVLVQPMVAAMAAGVAFTADPLTGDPSTILVSAVRGLGEPLVSGEAVGDQWRVRDGVATPVQVSEDALTAAQATAVADLAARVATRLGTPQDIEWAIEPDPGGRWRVRLLQARPMTAVPAPLTWTPPGPGVWHRNFRLGEWLPEPMTPLFADWLVPVIEAGYLDGMRDTIGAAVPFRWASVNGWYFNAPPRPSPRLLLSVVAHSRGRALPKVYNAIVRVSRDPVAADQALLGRLEQTWRQQELPHYQRLVAVGRSKLTADTQPDQVETLIDEVAAAAGRQLWFLAVVGGSAWKMEARLSRFLTEHLPALLGPDHPLAEGAQTLLRPATGPHIELPPEQAVFSLDWYWPIANPDPAAQPADRTHPGTRNRDGLAARRDRAEAACLAALAGTRWLTPFTELLEVTRRYSRVREEQAATLTLGWPLLRTCIQMLAQALTTDGRLTRPSQIHFLTRSELQQPGGDLTAVAAKRETQWQSTRRVPAPLILGTPPPLIGDPLQRAVAQARGGNTPTPADVILGQPASAGVATGPVRLLIDPHDFSDFKRGEVLVARATAPAWTPLFARAAAVVTDGGAITAHASIVAREYGIPAVVGTGDATHRLTTGQWVTVDGSAGTVRAAKPSQATQIEG